MTRRQYTKLRHKRRGEAVAAHHDDVAGFLSRYPTPGGKFTSLTIQSGWNTVSTQNIYDIRNSKC